MNRVVPADELDSAVAALTRQIVAERAALRARHEGVRPAAPRACAGRCRATTSRRCTGRSARAAISRKVSPRSASGARRASAASSASQPVSSAARSVAPARCTGRRAGEVAAHVGGGPPADRGPVARRRRGRAVAPGVDADEDAVRNAALGDGAPEGLGGRIAVGADDDDLGRARRDQRSSASSQRRVAERVLASRPRGRGAGSPRRAARSAPRR